MNSRIQYLDGLRGVAILLVIFFHAYSRWSEIVPYGETYADFPLFSLGWIGVQLFFLISGFVIFMTLDKTNSFWLYLYKRWLRLFPAMLIASILIYMTAFLFIERPAGSPNLFSLLPGLTFIEPGIWKMLFGFNIHPLEGAFWSLYVEFKFYIIAGVIYYVIGRKYLVPLLFSLYIFSLFISYISSLTDIYSLHMIDNILHLLSLNYFGWFSAGSMFYLYYKSQKIDWFWFAFFMAIFSSIFLKEFSFAPTVAGVLVSTLFALSLRVDILQKILQSKILTFLGFISYPLYLIHENMMVSMIIKMDYFSQWRNTILYPSIPLLILSIISFLIAKRYEVKVRKFIQDILSFR